MVYIPKNRILPNLYTNGNEFIVEETTKNYIGYYYKLYNGELYTGKTPNNTPSLKLITITPSPPEDDPIVTSQIDLPYDGFIESSDTYNKRDIVKYALLKGVNLKNPPSIELPTPFYPYPSEDAYKTGEFKRYFCIKANELKYTEISKDQCEKFKNKDDKVAFQYYTPFSFPWQISGEKKQVYQTNKNITLLTEKRIKRRGLQEFLRKNYLKFYEEDKQTTTSPTPKSKPSGRTSSY